MNLNETTLKAWFLVTFTDTPAPNQILWGTIQDDPSGRWDPDDWCCTSAILDQTRDRAFVTKNTRYTTVGPGTLIELPVKALIELRQGISPAEYRIMQVNPDMSLAFVREVLESQRDIETGIHKIE